MKKLIIILVSFCSCQVFAQNSTIATDGIFVPKVSSLATCASPSKGQMVFLSTDNKIYYCDGVNWQGPTGFSLPHTANSTFSNSIPLNLNNIGTNSTITSSIGNSNNDAYAIYGSTNGTGAAARFYSSNSNAEALSTSGKLKFSQNGEISGHVLTTDALGNATWRPSPNHNLAFAAHSLKHNSTSISGMETSAYPGNSYETLDFTVEEYDVGVDFSTTTDAFTAPYSGVYHFDAHVKYDNRFTNDGVIYKIAIFTNDNYIITETIAGRENNNSATVSTDLQLLAGMTVNIKTYSSVTYGGTFYLGRPLSRFSGHLVTRL